MAHGLQLIGQLFDGRSVTVEDAGRSDTEELPALADLAPLIERYDQRGPRYTSYPPAPVWSEDFDEASFRTALAASGGDELALYIHVPFCESLCTYCACNREISRDHAVVDPYLEALAAEARRIGEVLGRRRHCAQLALGGGTPTYLDAAQLERLCDIVDASFPPTADAERSIEVDPRVTSPAQLEALAARGFNRISFGVQDLSPKVQSAIHRVQSFEQTEALALSARGLGFQSLNLDLIYGLPYQTEASFDGTLDQILALRPDRIALYSYAHVTWVSKQQRGFERKDLPDARTKLVIFLKALRRLGQAGYRFLGLDHFALPDDELSRAADSGDLHRNFMGYTTRKAHDLVALGPSGISELADAYAQSERKTADWQKRIAGGGLATLRGWRLDAEDRGRRWLIQQLMCRGSIDPLGYRAVFDQSLGELVPDLEERLAPFVADGLLEANGARYRVTLLGRLFLRPLAMAFDAYLDAPAGSDAVRYSRTV